MAKLSKKQLKEFNNKLLKECSNLNVAPLYLNAPDREALRQMILEYRKQKNA